MSPAYQIVMEKNRMTTLKLLSAGLVAAGLLATPALAREHHSSARYATQAPDVSVQPMGGYSYGPGCTPAPRVGAFATQPWDSAPPCEPSAYSGYSNYSGYSAY
jgi:hypothetical protein